jgi:prepilin-type N-terminal cleavage/methylation domain-containing protein
MKKERRDSAFGIRHSAFGIRHSGKGFTLIEILATLALVAIVLPVAMSALTLAMNTALASRQRTEATALARSKMADLVAAGQWQDARQAGDFAPEQPDYAWSATVSDWEGTYLRQMDVEVDWQHRGETCRVMLSTLVYTGTAQ